MGSREDDDYWNDKYAEVEDDLEEDDEEEYDDVAAANEEAYLYG